jgi:pectin methylesterase-like acyl-CoA thioesterase
MQRVIAMGICLLLSGVSNAQVITVDDDGSADHTNIQAAIDASGNGDIVVVCPGTYTGADNYNINFGGRAITLRSTNPQDPTSNLQKKSATVTLRRCAGGTKIRQRNIVAN